MDGWKLFQEIRDGWPSVRAAKWIVWAALILGILLGSGGATIWWSGTVSALRERQKLAEDQRDDYKNKFGGATPDQAKAKVEALERTLNLVAGSQWEPLTKIEVERLAASLSKISPKFVNILYENQLGKDLGISIHEAFTLAKWPEVFLSQGAGLGIGLAVGRGSGTALNIKKAIEATTRLRPELRLPNEPDDIVYELFIGIRHN